VEIRGDYPSAVIDVDHVSSEKEVIDQCNDSPIGGAHGLAYRTPEIDTQMATGHPSVEQTA